VKIALPSDYAEHLAALPPGVEPAWYRSVEELVEAVADAEAAWYHVDPREAGRILEAGPGLRWLSSVGAGMDRWPLELLRERRDLVVTNGAGLAAIPIAEYTIACMLAVGRGMESILAANRRGEWDSKSPGDTELKGTRALIVGYGNIGRAIAERLRPFGVAVTGVRRRADGSPGVIGSDAWRERLGEFDWVILANPLTAETLRQIGPAEVAALKPGAWLVNVARGGLIDDDALLPALREGRVGGAVLDAFAVEPLPPDHEYWRLENVIVTPHISWKSSRAKARAAALFLSNLNCFVRGEKLANVVDLDTGY